MPSDGPGRGVHRISQSAALSLIEARQAGWWDPEHTLLLVSPAILAETPAGTIVGCIDGKAYEVGKDKIDNDTRWGMLAYGFGVLND